MLKISYPLIQKIKRSKTKKMILNHRKVNFLVNLLEKEMDSFLQTEDLKEKGALKVDQVQGRRAYKKVTDLLQAHLYLLVKFNNQKSNN